jgi:cob(I)alamin adenosyltransferase
MARINLTRIYTRLGDDGETHLGDMSRVPKTHARIEAFGAVDELNAQLGVLLASDAGLPDEFAPWLVRVQNDLFDVGADLSLPEGAKEGTPLRVTEGQTEWLEQRCDEVNARLEPLRSFVLPGGTAAAAQLSLCRAVCRRAERRVLAVDGASPEVARYLNRLSDMLFILSRAAAGGNERLWVPGESRDAIDGA